MDNVTVQLIQEFCYENSDVFARFFMNKGKDPVDVFRQLRGEPVSTPEFLKGLDLDQLRFARDCAAQMIAEKEQEEKVRLWVVQDGFMNVDFFSEGEYVKAAERLLRLAQERTPSSEERHAKDGELHLVPVFVPASEAKGWT